MTERQDSPEPKSRRKPAPDARPRLNRDRVLAAAVALADSAGLEAVTMRRLGAALGVEAMSLYNHVASRDDLVTGMVDRVVAEMAVPVPGADWRAEMTRRALSARAVLTAHPWAILPLLSDANVGPAMLAYADRTIGCLIEAGFSYPMADHAWNAIDSHVYGFTLKELKFPFAPEDYATAARDHLPMLPADRYPYLRATAEQVADGRHDGRQDFGLGLRILLDGLERLRGTEGPARAPAAGI